MAADPPQKRRLGKSIRTRWKVAQEISLQILELGCVFDQSGIDIFFLNRPPLHNLKDGDELSRSFGSKPGISNKTPLLATLRKAVEYSEGEKPVLLTILTDGAPDEGTQAFSDEVKRIVSRKSTTRIFKIQIIALTDDAQVIGWLDALDSEFKEVDVTSEYHTELEQVLRSGRVTKFTPGDWLMKARFGPLLPQYDELDESETAA